MRGRRSHWAELAIDVMGNRRSGCKTSRLVEEMVIVETKVSMDVEVEGIGVKEPMTLMMSPNRLLGKSEETFVGATLTDVNIC